MTKRKHIIFINSSRGWGKYTCEFCNKKIIAYNHDRHINSKLHKSNLIKQNVIQIDKDTTLRITGNPDAKFVQELRNSFSTKLK